MSQPRDTSTIPLLLAVMRDQSRPSAYAGRMPDNSHADYTPFPSFSAWNATEISYRDVESATSRFLALRNSVTREALDRALDTARRTAAVDTNAIEGIFATDRGFTRTVAEKTGAWEQALENKGTHVRPAFEDTLEGFELILDRVTGRQPVTETFIRELHSTMLRSQDSHTVLTPIAGKLVTQIQELSKGQYKRRANSPTRPDGTVHAYAPVTETAPEMARLANELRSPAFEEAPSVTQAAYAHHAFVCVHPFADGNGRVARALASIYLYRSPGVPLVIYQDQRANYIDALEAADRGEYHTLMRFFAERVTDTVNLIAEELSVPPHGSTADELSELLSGEKVPEAVLDAAERIKQLLREALQSRVDIKAEAVGLPFGTIRSLIGAKIPTPENYQPINDELATGLKVNTQSPRKLVVFWPVVLCSKNSDDADFDIVAVTATGRHLGIYLRELVPTISAHLRQRIGYFADAVVEEFLVQVKDAVKKADETR